VKKQRTQFAICDFRNWKDAVTSFNKHEASDQHTQATSFYIDAKRIHERKTSVASEVSAQHASQVDLNRTNLGRIIETVMLLGRQNIPFRGHDESTESTNRGNFIELLSWKDVPELAQHLTSKTHYTSPSQNEIIELVGSRIQAALVSKVQNNGVWSLIADEMSDISHHEQLSLCFHTVSNELVVEEHFFKYVAIPSTDAASLVAAIKDNVFDAGFPIKGLYFQCYDGASNMKGQYSGVAAQILKIAPKAVYIHCHSHLLNLSLQNSCSSIQPVRNCLGQVNALYHFLEALCKRHALMTENQKAANEDDRTKTLIRLCETR